MLRKIIYFVVGSHLVFILLLFFSPVQKAAPATKHIAVRTATIRPVEKKAAPSPKPVEKKKVAAAPKPKPQPLKSKKPAVNDAPQKKKVKTPPAKTQEEPEEITTKIDSKKEKSYSSPKLDVPAPIEKNRLTLADIIETSDYQELLVSYLHQMLNLPDYGEVRIQLTLSEDGTVTKMVVLKTESQKNKEYLERNLPMLKFPRLFSNKKEETFMLTFCNEI